MRSKLWLKFLPTLLFLVFSASALAQAPFEPIYTSSHGPILNVRWSEDSRLLTFQERVTSEDEGVISPHSSWYEYLVGMDTNDELIKSDFWPLYPTDLKDDTANQLRTAVDLEGQISYVLLSPDQRYALYAAPQPPDWGEGEGSIGWPLAITDLRTHNTTFVRTDELGNPIIHVFSLDSMSYFDIRWNSDSSAFTIEFDTPYADHRTYYVTNFTDDIDTALASRIEVLSDSGDLLGYGDALDISSDGEQVLSVGHPWVFIWDSQDPKNIQILVQTESPVLAATFAPDNEQKIMYISETGLMEYDLETQEIITLDASINSEWAHDAWFSPDGKRVALIDKNTTKLYVLDVPLS